MGLSVRAAGERLQPVATLDFSGFDVLNAAATPVAPKAPEPSREQQQPDPPSPGPVEMPGPPQRSSRLTAALRGRRSGGQSERAVARFESPAATEQTDNRVATRLDHFDDDADFGAFEDLDHDDPEVSDLPAPRVTRTTTAPARSSGFVRFSRKVLGLDRPDNKLKQGRASMGAQDPAWLAGLDEPHPQRRHGPQPAPVQRGPESVVAAQKRRPGAGSTRVIDDVEVTSAPPGFMPGLWLWVARVAVAVIFLAGLNQVFIKPFRGTTMAAVVVPMNAAASQQAAARYVSDYLSFFPGRGPAQLTVLQNDAIGSAGAAVAQWVGTGYLRADAVLPGQMTFVDSNHAVVAVAARIHLAMPPAQPAQRIASSTAAALPGADPGPVPAGWTDLGSRWIELNVPVQMSNGAVLVSSEGTVFAGEAPQLIGEPVGGQVDSKVTTGTQSVATSLLTAYASSDVAYLAAPGVSLAGLHSAVSFVSLTGWSVSLPAGSATSGTGTGLVTWQLTGTDLRIAQPYAIALTSSQSRWYGAALGPDQSAQ